MKKLAAFVITFSLITAGSVAIEAQEQPAPPVEQDPVSAMRISLSLRNIDIHEALKFFSLKTGLNIVPTQKVSGRVTLSVENAPVRDVFDIMLRSNSLAYSLRNGIYNVMTEDEYKALFGKKFVDLRQVKVFRLKYAVPEQAFTLLDALKSDIGRLLVDQESGSVMIVDIPEKIAEAQAALESLEQKNVVKVFDLKYAKAKEVESQLKLQLDEKRVGMVRSDERTNQVIVQALPDRLDNIEMLIKSLDKKTKAVLIDTKIIKIVLNNQHDRGVQWEGLFQLAAKYGMAYMGSYPFSVIQSATSEFQTRRDYYAKSVAAGGVGSQIGSYPFSGNTASTGGTSTKSVVGQNMHIGILGGKRDFDAVVNYLDTIGKSKVIASPSLSVVNNQEAKIHIGERRAYVTTTTTTGTTTKTVSEAVTYVDVGVRLSVTPTINDDGFVTIRVKPEISNIIGDVTSSSGNKIPVIDTNTAETTVLAKNGSTIVIGGLGREEIAESTDQLPFLGSIPLIGFAFRNSTKKTQHVELVIMLTPIITEGDKFITGKDAEKFPVKPAKHFDVFKPEAPDSAEVFIPITQQRQPKPIRPYLPNLYGSRREDEQVVPVKEAAVVKGMRPQGETFIVKGARSYN